MDANIHSHLIIVLFPWTYRSPHPKRHLDRLSRFCTAHGRACVPVLQWAVPFPVETAPSRAVSYSRLIHMVPWVHPSPQPKWHLNRLSYLCTAHCRVSSRMPGHVFFPKNYPFAWGDLDTHLIHGSLGPLKYSTQMAPRSVQPFLHGRPQNVPIIYNGPPFLKIAPSHQDVHLHLVHRSLGPPKS